MNNIMNYVVNFDEWNAAVEGNMWGGKVPQGIDGAEAVASANEQGLTIAGILNEGVRYVFRWDVPHTKLIPARVSMSLKTMANLERGSRRYGHLHILAQL